MQGIAASPGIALGEAYLKQEEFFELEEIQITGQEVNTEISRLHRALKAARKELDQLNRELTDRLGEERAAIFQAHQLLLDDPQLIGSVEGEIRENLIKAEMAVDSTIKKYLKIFETMEDQYLAARAIDLRDVGKRLLKLLNGHQEVTFPEKPVIVIARELTPSDTARLDPKKVLGFATEEGSTNSHTAIMARSLGIPAVVGLGKGFLEGIHPGDRVIIDGSRGRVLINPTAGIEEDYQRRLQLYSQEQKRLGAFVKKKSRTKDGLGLELSINIISPEQLDSVQTSGGDGIGLFRTEFLYMNREELPAEEEQFQVYRKAARKLGARPLIIRTLDLGGDKTLPYLDLPEESNPFLGYRAIRVCNRREDIFKPQLRALLRASSWGNLKIMYPMITSLEELRRAKGVLEEVKGELDSWGVEYNPEVELGIMIETPAAAVVADLLAREVDFFSIGTNDLIQYTLAVDRTNQQIADLYTPYHPGVLRLIKQTIEAAEKEGIWVSLCGEAAGDVRLFPFLLGAGLTRFSMGAPFIPAVKELLGRLTLKESRRLVEGVLKEETAAGVESCLDDFHRRTFTSP